MVCCCSVARCSRQQSTQVIKNNEMQTTDKKWETTDTGEKQKTKNQTRQRASLRPAESSSGGKLTAALKRKACAISHRYRAITATSSSSDSTTTIAGTAGIAGNHGDTNGKILSGWKIWASAHVHAIDWEKRKIIINKITKCNRCFHFTTNSVAVYNLRYTWLLFSVRRDYILRASSSLWQFCHSLLLFATCLLHHTLITFDVSHLRNTINYSRRCSSSHSVRNIKIIIIISIFTLLPRNTWRNAFAVRFVCSESY